MTTAAIHYTNDAFSIDRADIKGRHSAGAGFLAGVTRHLPGDPLYCYAATMGIARHCADAVAATRPRPVKWIPFGQEQLLAEPGCLFISAPGLDSLAWRRRGVGQRLYSLCGVTHTICSAWAFESFAQYLTAPLQPWDAVVCTSRPAQAAIVELLERQADYLGQRLGAAVPMAPLQLPVIPLGVDCDRYAGGPQAEARRTAFRQRHRIADDDVALLFFGRLAFHAKAHPLPLLMAAEQAAQRTRRRLHAIFTGRFPNPQIAEEYRVMARDFAPSLQVHFVDGTDDELSLASWFGADIFVSPSDNIQETFGLTPIEAQAAGLPAVVSDWDGYKDTVKHGETGLRIPTRIPSPGAGQELMDQYAAGGLSYDRYIGYASLCTAMDIGACAEALQRLADDDQLRARMGQAARRHARETYDWSVVVGQYRALWGELAEIRASAAEVAPPRPGQPKVPIYDDPFRVFAGFATETLDGETVLGVDADCTAVATMANQGSVNYGASQMLPPAVMADLAARLRRAPRRIAELETEAGFAAADPRLRRSLMWMLKFDMVRRVRSEA